MNRRGVAMMFGPSAVSALRRKRARGESYLRVCMPRWSLGTAVGNVSRRKKADALPQCTGVSKKERLAPVASHDMRGLTLL